MEQRLGHEKSENENCIFCKITSGKIPSYKVYEDEHVFCFLDIHPASKGHILIVPKEHFENIFDAPHDILPRLLVVAQQMSIKLKTRLGATGVNILHASGKDAQQSVFHFHIHIVPRYHNDGYDLDPKTGYKETSFDEIIKKLNTP